LARIAKDRGLAGPISEASAFLFKHPPEQIEDTDAHDVVLRFVNDEA
jgi:myo-inositol-1-phosphate synthase